MKNCAVLMPVLGALALCAIFLLIGCGAGERIEPASEQANQACVGHHGVAQIVKEAYDPETGGGGIEAVVCRDGVVK